MYIFLSKIKILTKLEVRPSFSVSQNGDRKEVLELFQKFLKCGTIRANPSDRTYKYEVRSIKDLISKVIPHFLKYPLRSSKQKEVVRFAKICQLILEKKHLQKEYLREIVETAYEMNGFGARKYNKQEILHVIGEDIVYASSN